MWTRQLPKATYPRDGPIARLLEPHGLRLLFALTASNLLFRG